MKKRRLCAAIICGVFCAMVLSCLFWIVMGACHECITRRCEICFVAQISAQQLRGIVQIVVAFAVLFFFVCRGVQILLRANRGRAAPSLVLLKVKLSN